MSLMPRVLDAQALRQIPDARVLETMSKCVFQAGFAWKVIENKWPGFLEAFFGFDPQALVLLSPDDLERLGRDTRIVRNMQKILTVPQNAQWINAIAAQHGSFGAYLADWPAQNLVGLFAQLKRHGARLGGNTGQRVLRILGKDTFMLSADVVTALLDAGLEISPRPTSKHDLQQIQNAFNAWHDQTGLPYAHLSKVLAYSMGENYEVEFIRREMGLFDRT